MEGPAAPVSLASQPPPISAVRTHRYRLLPTAKQHRALERILESQRLLYNAALHERVDAWQKRELSITWYDQCKSLTQIRADDRDGYGALPVRLSRATLWRLDTAFQGFFRRVKAGQTPGFPRFKPMTRWASFGFVEFKGIRLQGRRLWFKGMPGGLKVHVHHPLPESRDLLCCQFRRDAKGWFVTLQVRYTTSPRPHQGPAIGVDLGIEKLAALSDGICLSNPRIGVKYERRLRRVQRILQRSQKGSTNRAKRRRALARVHLAVANARNTHLHQQSAFLTQGYGTIVVEKLSIQRLTATAKGARDAWGKNVRQKSSLNKSLLDVAWGRFRKQLRYKAESAGGRVIEVPPHMTSQACSGCGAVVRKSLAERTHECPSCGLVIDRDVNAARNILARGLALLNGTSGVPSPDRGVVAPGWLNAGAGMAACQQKRWLDTN
jgi:putative transposase